jgi:GntR family transcriptional repressor for pyruvate dehydrogenase complex
VGKEHPQVGSFRLPTERLLAEQLNVQRSTLRDRLATLEHLGVLRRTQGSGTFVEPLGADVIRLYFDLALALGYVGIEDMSTARRMLEREIARQAAVVALDEEIEELAAVCRTLESASTDAERLKAEYEFHMSLAVAAKNPVITLIVEGLSSVLRRNLARRRFLIRAIPDAGRRADACHMPIVDALRARDPERAMRAMDEHFRITDELWATESARYLVAGGAPPDDEPHAVEAFAPAAPAGEAGRHMHAAADAPQRRE